MLNTRAVRGWHQMLTNQGLLATVRVAKERLARRFQSSANDHTLADPGPGPAHEPLTVHPFDLDYGVDTGGLIWGEHLASGSRNDRWSTAYYGIAPSVFEAVLSHIRDSIPGATFVDIGSGKGRAVMLAAQLPFAEVIGVELSPELHSIATSNLGIFQHRSAPGPKVRLYCLDAAEFEFPAQPLVLFFYHPFCKPVLKTVLHRLEQSLRALPRPAHVVYINPELRELLDHTPYLSRIFSETLTMSVADQLADRVGSSVEECAIYMSTVTP